MSALGQRQEKPRRPSQGRNCYILQGNTNFLLLGQLIALVNFPLSMSADEDAAPGPISRHAICHVMRLVVFCFCLVLQASISMDRLVAMDALARIT